jgi:MFS family permease
MSEAYPARMVWPAVIGSAVNAVSTSMIATAIVPITADLGVTPAAAVSLVTVLYVASAVVQPLAGAIADQLGARSTFISGMLVVAVAGVVGGCAGSLGGLLVARGLTGLGTSAAYPSVIVLLREREQATGVPIPSRVLGAVAIAVQVAAGIGLPLGGVMTAALGWRATFWVTAPVGAALAWAAWAWFPRPPARRPVLCARQFLSFLDPLGVTLFLATVASLAVATVPDPWESATPYAICLVSLGALVWWERRTARPFLDVVMLRHHPALGRTLLRTLMTFLVVYGFLYGVTQWLQDARGLGALATALLLAPMSLLSVTVSVHVSTRDSVWRPLIVGAACGLLACAMLLGVLASDAAWTVVPVALAIGLLIGLTGVANQTALLAQTPPGRAGSAAGMMRAASNVAAILSGGLIAWWYPVRADDRGLLGIATSMVVALLAVIVLTALDRRMLRSV